MKIGIILYECTEDDYRALYALSRIKAEQSVQEQLKRAQSLMRRRKEALQKAKALGLYCITGGKSRKGVANG